MNTPRSQRGFSLIELAVVLVIIGLLVGGGIAALNSATQQTRRIEAERQLLHVRDALYGYAMSEGRLPCPDTDDPPDGNENAPSGGPCDANGGVLPWVDLGVGRRDPWGAPLRYRIYSNGTLNFADTDADPNEPSFRLDDPDPSLPTPPDYLIVEDGDSNEIVSLAPAVVLSFGPQGERFWADGNCPPSGSTDFSTDEIENCDNDNTFIATEYRPPDATSGRFDDLVIWIPLPVLKSRMVDAGLLP